RLVEEFRGHTEGANPGRKTSENAKQRAKHVVDFLEYMADSAIPNADLLFLSNHARIRGFVAVLQEKGFKPTTQRCYLMDAVAFMKYISNMAPPSVRLGTKNINAILVELRARIRDIGRDVVGHQLSVRRTDLEKHPEDRACLKEFFGLLGGYIIATTGHRKGVVINMTTKEVKAAEKTKQGARIIRVGQHKTQRYFGEAAVPLKPSEYSWLQRYNLLRNRIEGGKEASTFFHTTSGGILLKLSEYFKEAWEGMGLGTAPTFNMLRSSVATYAKRQLGHKTYQKVATFMCHDANTAKRFYQAEDPADVTLQSRGLSMMAISTYAAKTRKRREKHKKDNTMTIASSEDEREDNEPAENEDNQGFEEEEQEPLGQEKPVRKRLNQLHSNKTLVPSDQQMVSSSEEDDAGDMKTTLTETVPDPDEEHVPKRTYQLREKRASVPLNQKMMQQAFVSPETAKILSTHSRKTVCDRVNMVNKLIFHQSSLFEVIMPISGDNIKHQAGSTVGQMIPSGSMGETVSQEWLLENEVSVGDTTLHKSLPKERPGDYEGQEKEGEVDEGYLEMSKIEGEDRNKAEDKLKEGQETEKETQEETLEKMDSDGEEGQKAKENIHSDGGEGHKTDEKRQEETLEKMESKSEKGKKRDTKIQEKTLENMEGKSEKGKKRETKIQEKTLENMEGKSERGKKRETKIQEKTLENMESKSERGKKRKTKIQEKTLENMEGKSEKGKRRETKIQEKTLEKMESKSEKGKKRETKIQDEPVVMTRSKVKELQKRKIKEEHLEKSERESGEGSSGVAQTLKMPLKRRKFQE
ncbi:hypothetical protein ABVT39_012021, partial [Epinephelus coioides]